jgi:hypothetical protein
MAGNTVVLGGSGAMTSSCVYDLYQTSGFDTEQYFDEMESRGFELTKE